MRPIARTGPKTLSTAVTLMLLLPLSAFATQPENPAQLCLDAARIAADETGVPLPVMIAITLAETGHTADSGATQPWPWATNQGGDGHWFATAQEAADFIDAKLAEGITNIDIGCFQLNFRWHANAFTSTADMLDPLTNARYAARLLQRHFAETGDWSAAAGAYHSGTPDRAQTYRDRFDSILASLDPNALPTVPPEFAPTEPRVNTFPLLIAGSAASGPSLFPTLQPGPRLIGG